MDKKLMELKELIAKLHNKMLDLSAGLWELNTKVDDMLIENIGHISYMKDYDKFVDKINDAKLGENDKAVEMCNEMYHERAVEMCNEMYQQEKEQPIIIKGRGRPRKEAMPEAQEVPLSPELQRIVKATTPEPQNPAKASEMPQKEHKASIVERLLGKDADQKAKMRAERMAQLEKELADLNQKK